MGGDGEQLIEATLTGRRSPQARSHQASHQHTRLGRRSTSLTNPAHLHRAAASSCGPISFFISVVRRVTETAGSGRETQRNVNICGLFFPPASRTDRRLQMKTATPSNSVHPPDSASTPPDIVRTIALIYDLPQKALAPGATSLASSLIPSTLSKEGQRRRFLWVSGRTGSGSVKRPL